MKPTIRVPAVAGSFYPAEPARLERDVVALLEPQEESPVAARLLMVPHAGYVYSGRIAGLGYRAVAVPPLVVVLAPNHYGIGAELALPLAGTWRTPLGDLEIDAEASRAVAGQSRLLRDDWRAHARDHSLEVQLPFLQVRARSRLPRLVTISVGTHDLETLLAVGRAVAAGLRELERAGVEDVLLVVSSDMSHYIPADEARRRDLPVLERVRRLDAEGVHEEVFSRGVTMCGVAPAVAGLAAARELGASEGRLLRYGHSGEVTGEDSDVVAYATVLVPGAA